MFSNIWTLVCVATLFVSTYAKETALKKDSFNLRLDYEDGVYEFSAIRLDWFSAKNYCKLQGLGYELLSIETVGENTFVMNALSTALSESFWISASDLYQEGDFYWDSTGQHLGPFTNWAPEEPSGSKNEHCVELNVDNNHLWNDVNCDMEKLFVCEWHPCPNATLLVL